MKIGIDIRLIGKNQTGSEAVFFNLVRNLARIDRENEYKLFTDVTEEEALGKIRSDLAITGKKNIEIVSLGASNRFVWNFWALSRYLTRNPVDAYLTQYITPWFVPEEIKIATIIHDISFNFYPQLIKKTDLFFLKTLIPASLRRANRIIGVSRFTRDEIIKYYKVDPKKVDWIYNAVSDEFKAQDISREKIDLIKKKYALPEKYILYIGTLQPRKNLPVLIEAYGKIRGEVAGYKLVLAGGRGHNFDDKIIETVEKNGLSDQVILPGFIEEDDKAASIAGADVFCFPSLYEGFGIPILEAMSVGTPVVASRILPHEEIAQGSVAFFDPENPEELSEKLLEAIGNTAWREKLIAGGRRQVEKFSWQETSNKMLNILKKTC